MESRKGSKMLSWEDMSQLEQAQCIYWDMYKDAYGVRPRGIDTTDWSLEQFEKEFEFLGKVIEQEEIARKAAEAEAIVSLSSMLPIQFVWVLVIVKQHCVGFLTPAKLMETKNTFVS